MSPHPTAANSVPAPRTHDRCELEPQPAMRHTVRRRLSRTIRSQMRLILSSTPDSSTPHLMSTERGTTFDVGWGWRPRLLPKRVAGAATAKHESSEL